ncbi:putative acetyltransferase [Yinghuangia aomiensis]
MNRITPHDVGRRVSVRRRLSPEGAPPQFGDVVGVLDAWSAGVLTITRKDGSITRVDEHTLVAGRGRSPGPGARAGRSAGGVVCRPQPIGRGLLSSMPRWAAGVCGRPGGFTARANSVLALGEPGRPFDAALAEAERWYADRGLPCLFQTVDGDAEDRALAGLGWAPVRAALFQTGRLAAARDRLDAVDDSRVELSGTFDDAWMSLYRRVDDLSPRRGTCWRDRPAPCSPRYAIPPPARPSRSAAARSRSAALPGPAPAAGWPGSRPSRWTPHTGGRAWRAPS